jgi:hypothetical protein
LRRRKENLGKERELRKRRSSLTISPVVSCRKVSSEYCLK